jgi:epoxide hydrolase-like predicted phosphatase
VIKAVLFDFGGVLSEAGGRGTIRRAFGEAYGLDRDVMDVDDLYQKMWRGQITDEDFLAEVSRRNPGTPVLTAEQFRSHLDKFKRSEPVYDLVERLRAAGIKTAILSNVFGIGVGPIRSGGFYEGFDPVLLSCDTGLAKPEKEFYKMAIERLGAKPEEIIFIDDQEVCLEPAKKMGMHVILAKSLEQIVRDTKAIIYKQNGINL